MNDPITVGQVVWAVVILCMLPLAFGFVVGIVGELVRIIDGPAWGKSSRGDWD